jgi:hypothetical protein
MEIKYVSTRSYVVVPVEPDQKYELWAHQDRIDTVLKEIARYPVLRGKVAVYELTTAEETLVSPADEDALIHLVIIHPGIKSIPSFASLKRGDLLYFPSLPQFDEMKQRQTQRGCIIVTDIREDLISLAVKHSTDT